MVQNENFSQNEVITEFKKNINSVLLGTGTYWEGKSVEGMALSNLVMFKLPFQEPIIDYKISMVQEGLDVLVAEMIIKLKQGIGHVNKKWKRCRHCIYYRF